ncbi:molybdate ABC transporter substrate-binding protein, partial [Klebsiella pneumoniae]|uniref:molybdate ABC transporter substrate-binding protein n=1 Tax=Klebsiella pneumoniae TaxID=573 RepID=UPI002175E8A3
QIEQGAPADLFISADQQWMDYAIDKQQMVKDTRYTLLGNELVLIAAKSDKQDKIAIDKQTDWAKLLNGGRLAVGDPFDEQTHVGAMITRQHWEKVT